MHNARTATKLARLDNNSGTVKQQSEEIEWQQILIEALNAYTYLIMDDVRIKEKGQENESKINIR